jgi:hypothetical protein
MFRAESRARGWTVRKTNVEVDNVTEVGRQRTSGIAHLEVNEYSGNRGNSNEDLGVGKGTGRRPIDWSAHRGEHAQHGRGCGTGRAYGPRGNGPAHTAGTGRFASMMLILAIVWW